MKNKKNYILISLVLVFISFAMFLGHYLIFGQLENTIYYSLMSLCFIPINILGVTIVFENLVERRARLDRLSKLNMLVGLFFSDIGFALLSIIVAGDKKIHNLNLDFSDLKDCKNKLIHHEHDIDFENIDYEGLKNLVIESRSILTNLIGNENILEHEIFADLLMALMHLRDEILCIKYKNLTKEDRIHLKGDVIRVYRALSFQWICYLEHLKQFYPYQYNSDIKYNPYTLIQQSEENVVIEAYN